MLDGGVETCTVNAEATAALREKLKAGRRGEPPMIDRGSGFEKMLRGEVKPWTRYGVTATPSPRTRGEGVAKPDRGIKPD